MNTMNTSTPSSTEDKAARGVMREENLVRLADCLDKLVMRLVQPLLDQCNAECAQERDVVLQKCFSRIGDFDHHTWRALHARANRMFRGKFDTIVQNGLEAAYVLLLMQE